MQRLTVKHFLILITALAAAFFFYKEKFNEPKTQPPVEKLEIISTSPNPLEEATILPTQSLEITFNKPLYRSQFKHKFDPEIEHEVEVVNGIDKELGSVFRIKFSKPLPLGSGYTLFIFTDTKTEDGFNLEAEHVYHFKTIKFRGV